MEGCRCTLISILAAAIRRSGIRTFSVRDAKPGRSESERATDANYGFHWIAGRIKLTRNNNCKSAQLAFLLSSPSFFPFAVRRRVSPPRHPGARSTRYRCRLRAQQACPLPSSSPRAAEELTCLPGPLKGSWQTASLITQRSVPPPRSLS